jgi:MFS family permease
MLALLSAGSVLGRILTNVLADKLGAFQLLLPCTFVTGCLGFVWIGIRSPPGAIAFCVLYGFFAGAIVSLAPFALVTISPDLSVVGTRMGMSFGFASFGLLIGSPIGGALLKTNAGFTAVQVFCGTLVTVGLATCTLSGLEYRKRMRHEVKAPSV